MAAVSEATKKPRGEDDAKGLADDQSEQDAQHQASVAFEHAERPGNTRVGQR